MKQVLVTHQIPEAGISLLKKSGLKVYVNKADNKPVTPAWLLKHVKGVDALVSDLTDIVDKKIYT